MDNNDEIIFSRYEKYKEDLFYKRLKEEQRMKDELHRIRINNNPNFKKLNDLAAIGIIIGVSLIGLYIISLF